MSREEQLAVDGLVAFFRDLGHTLLDRAVLDGSVAREREFAYRVRLESPWPKGPTTGEILGALARRPTGGWRLP